jgi:hypothetical protein
MQTSRGWKAYIWCARMQTIRSLAERQAVAPRCLLVPPISTPSHRSNMGSHISRGGVLARFSRSSRPPQLGASTGCVREPIWRREFASDVSLCEVSHRAADRHPLGPASVAGSTVYAEKANTFARERESGFRLPASARTATPAVSCANGSYNPNRRQGRTSRTARTKWLGPTSRSPDAATKPATLSRADHRPSRRRKLDGTRGPTLVSRLARGGPSWSGKRPNTT